MSDIVIRVQNVSKSYRISKNLDGRYQTIRDALLRKCTTLFSSSVAAAQEDFWALKDVSFEVKRGECVGIIGPNGAGKSTLLKILSRITEPTTGRIELHGRIGSLLEVGTGFHTELTGRENIYLNGAILGMTHKEIDRKFDEIVDFSEIEQFLDTPVKRYSSGMYMRLAFSVAVHLEPEIIVIDEVLAVGDAQFQKKCLGKMKEIGKEGRTILFVSHNMGAILNLCKTCILLEKGKEKMIGEVGQVVREYEMNSGNEAGVSLLERKDRSGNGKVRIVDLEITNQDKSSFIKSYDRLRIRIKFENKIMNFRNFHIIMGCWGVNSLGLFRIDTGDIPIKNLKSPEFVIETNEINLNSLFCALNIVLLIDGERSDYVMNAKVLNILENNRENVTNFPSELATILIETKYEYP